MSSINVQLTPEQRAALLQHPGEPVHIADEETHKVYLLVEQGAFPELEEEYVRAKLEEGFAAIERGEVSTASIDEVVAKARTYPATKT